MTPSEFDYLTGLVKTRSGIVLSKDKMYLIESRLLPVARKINKESLSALVAEMRRPGQDKLIEDVIEAMTTNESFFFRDKTPFEHFEKVMLPALKQSRASARKLRIWCAAASTGQEPYSLAMLLKEKAAELAGWRFEIIGTDISKEVLDRAKSGLYTQFEVQRGLPVQLMLKYFKQTGDMWQVDPALRSMVQYKPFNLLDSYTSMGQFDIIFCRNVLIYFDQATKSDIMGRLSKQVSKDGYLVLGAAETVVGLTDSFKSLPEHRGLYVPTGVEPAQGSAIGNRAAAATGGGFSSGSDTSLSRPGFVKTASRAFH